MNSSYKNPNLFSQPDSYRRWITNFIRALFDFSFSEVITLKMLPLLYGLAIIALLVGSAALSFEVFTHSIWRGITYLIFIAPIFFIFGVAAIRSFLEFFSAVFRMQSGLEKLEQHMNQLSEQMNNLNTHIMHMSDHMEHMRKDFSSVMEVMENIDEMTDKIPFIKKQRKPMRDQWAESTLAERADFQPPQK